MLNNKLNNINVVLILLSICLIVPKWIFSYYLFPNEDLLFKILNETRSIAYYPLINNLSDFNLSPLYEPNIKDIRGIFGFPIMNLIILSLFWKILSMFLVSQSILPETQKLHLNGHPKAVSIVVRGLDRPCEI